MAFSILANLLLMGFYMALLRPVFETNDDMSIALFVNRGRLVQDPLWLFMNYLLGLICSALYRITNMLPWYGLMQAAGLFCAFTAVFYVIMQLFDHWSALTVSLLILNFFAADAYTSIQFTKTAGVCASAGMMLVVYAMLGERLKKPQLIFGLLISLYGILYRDREAVIMIALWCFFGLYLLMNLWELPRKDRGRRALRYFGVLGLCFALLLGAHLFDEYGYKSHPESSAYRDLNNVRSELTDYGFPRYEENQELFDELGISYNAYRLLSRWNFYDPDVFPLRVQERLLEAQKRKEINLETLQDFFSRYPLKWFENPMFYGYLCLLTLVLLFGKRDGRTWTFVLLEQLVLTLLFFLIFAGGRFNLHRVDNPIWLCACLLLCFALDREKFGSLSSKGAIALVLLVFIMQQNLWRESYRSATEGAILGKNDYKNLIAKTARDEEHLYLGRVGFYQVGTAYGPFDLVPLGAAANTAALGGWPAGSPGYIATLRKYGVSNPYRDMINNRQVFLIEDKDSIDLVLNYIREYYDEAAKARDVGSFGKYRLYRIESESGSGEEAAADGA